MENINTINDLEIWINSSDLLDKNFAIGEININEGFGLEKFGYLFIWYYLERGKKENLDYFRTEKDAVNFALKKILELQK